MQTMTGQHIKGYELQERIAAGGFGAVYRAYQSTVGREVAVKIILPSLANKPDFIRRFEAEAQLIARLEHMNIVPLYDYWRDPEGAYLVMRFLRGGSLHDYIQKHGKLDIEDAFNMLVQISQGLYVAHRNQIVHRDIKPANILLDEDNNAYLGDFGIAKDYRAAESITQPDSLIGSPEYLAPEQARSDPVSAQTDIYSLGVVLYEMLTGEHPFPGVDKITYIYKHLNDPLPEIMDLDENIRWDVNSVIEKATAKDPKQRFSDVIAMIEALRQAAQLHTAPTPTSLVELLTPREQEVMQLIIDGKSNREIADILVLTEGTVKQYITSIYRKLKVRSRVQAIARARDLDFVIKKPQVTATTGYLPIPQNPYKGLGAFQAADNQNFFGRENLVQKLLNRLKEDVEYHRFLTVVGPSGSGKSSVVKAGLIPALWRGDLQTSDNWYIIDILPGAHPIDELEVALFQITTDKTINLREQLERDQRGLLRVANMLLPDDGSELLLVIDQFEEVFTLVNDEDERLHFLRLIREAITDKRSRVRVIATLRADYYDRPLQYSEIGDLVRDRVETVLPLSAEELERAISEPANLQGVLFEEGLVSRIVSDVHYQPGSLPLLQYALTELFERRNGHLLTLAAYQEIGGTGGALANRADEIYHESDESGQHLIRQMFLRLVTLGEGAEDTRRRIERSELLDITSNKELMGEMIDLYASSRLLSLDRDPASRRPTVEVAHEAILREWERLRHWLNESREDIRQERLIALASDAWNGSKRDNSYLLTGIRLEQATKWREQTALALTPLEKEYIQFSIDQTQVKELAEIKRLEREASLERRSQIVMRALVGVFAVAAIIATGLSVVALKSSSEAAAERDNAQTNFLRAERIRLAAQAQIALDSGDDVRIPALLALRSLAIDYSPEADSALLTALTRDFPQQTYIGHSGDGITGIYFSPDGSHILSLGTDGTARLWDTFTGEEVQRFSGHAHILHSAVFMPDGETLLTSGDDGTIRQWDIATGDEIARILEQDISNLKFALSPDAQFLATTNDGSQVNLWQLDTMALLHTLEGHTDLVNDVEFSPDGQTLASASFDRTVRLWDVETGEALQRYEGHAARILEVDFSPDGTTLASASDDSTVRLWNVETGEEIQRFFGVDSFLSVAFSPDGKELFAGTRGVGFAKIWDIATGNTLFDLTGNGNSIGFVAYSPDGEYLLSSGAINITNLWRREVENEPRIYVLPNGDLHTDAVSMATLTNGDSQILTVLGSGAVRVWDVETHQNERTFFADAGGFVFDATLTSQQDRLLTVHEDGIARLWDIETTDLISEFDGRDGRITTIAVGADDTYFVTGSDNGVAVLWTTRSEEPLQRFAGHTAPITDVSLSPDGNFLITASEDGTVRLWDAENGTEIRSFTGHDGAVFSVAFSPDGQYIVTGGEDNLAILWRVETGEIQHRLVGHALPITVVGFSTDGQQVITGSRDKTARLWDSGTGEVMRQFTGHSYQILSSSLSEDGELLVIGDLGFTYLWRAELQEIRMLTCQIIPYDLTSEERIRYNITDNENICA